MFYVIYDDVEAIIIFPLYKKLGTKNYCLYGDKTGCAYLNAVHGGDLAVEDMRKAVGILKKEINGNLEIHRVQEETVLGKYVLDNGGRVSDEPCVYIPVLNNYDEYFKSLSRNTRNNIRKAYNRAIREGKKIIFEHGESGHFSEKDKEVVRCIYSIRQSKKYRGVGRIAFRIFSKRIDIGGKALTELKGFEYLFIVKVDGDIAAFVDTCIRKKQIILIRLAINDEYGFYNPGKILIDGLMRFAFDSEKFEIFDLSHGDDRYKLEMGGVKKYCVEGVI